MSLVRCCFSKTTTARRIASFLTLIFHKVRQRHVEGVIMLTVKNGIFIHFFTWPKNYRKVY